MRETTVSAESVPSAIGSHAFYPGAVFLGGGLLAVLATFRPRPLPFSIDWNVTSEALSRATADPAPSFLGDAGRSPD
jgi:hypothetical protein